MRRTRLGVLIRAATQDRPDDGALGVNQAWLFTGIFALGSALAALGERCKAARTGNLALDMTTIGDAFVVVVVGGWQHSGRTSALVIAEIKAICYGIGTVSARLASFAKLTLVVQFLVMAAC